MTRDMRRLYAAPSQDADLSAVTSRLWAMLSKADSDCAEMVEINENANQDEPAEPIDIGVTYHLEGSHDGVFWDQCDWAATIAGLGKAVERCPYKHARIAMVTRQIVHVEGVTGHA